MIFFLCIVHSTLNYDCNQSDDFTRAQIYNKIGNNGHDHRSIKKNKINQKFKFSNNDILSTDVINFNKEKIAKKVIINEDVERKTTKNSKFNVNHITKKILKYDSGYFNRNINFSKDLYVSDVNNTLLNSIHALNSTISNNIQRNVNLITKSDRNYTEKNGNIITPEEYSDFNYLVNIIIFDLLNTLNGYKLLYGQIDYIENLIRKIELCLNFEYDIIYVLEIFKELIDYDFCANMNLSKEKLDLFSSILFTKYHEKTYLKNFHNKCFSVMSKMDKIYEKNLREIFLYTIKQVNETNDNNMRFLFMYGIQNIFHCNKNKKMAHFSMILVFLYIFNNEQKSFDMGWHEKLFSMISSTENPLKGICLKK